jgi:hypothetical protein
MWYTFFLVSLTSLFFLTPAAGMAQISVDIVSDNGSIYPSYPVSSRDRSVRAYVEAIRNDRYGIRVTNRSNQRVGVVIAVDGRNIISGEKSYLRNTERMYILDPYAQGTYTGWRTGRNEIRRFYFTDAGDSYAGAWDDHSAMGVIAVVAYAEQRQQVSRRGDDAMRRSAPMAAAPAAGRYGAESVDGAGTGYGERERSTSVRVEFTPERHALARHFYKYEWRETLCQKNIISCRPSRRDRQRDNRFWPNDGYVPPPPSRR